MSWPPSVIFAPVGGTVSYYEVPHAASACFGIGMSCRWIARLYLSHILTPNEKAWQARLSLSPFPVELRET